MITGFEISRKDRGKMQTKVNKDAAKKHDSQLKRNKISSKVTSAVSAGYRRMSLTFGADFNKDREKRRKQYQQDIEKLQLYGGTEADVKYKEKGKKNNLKQKVSGTVRRLSVSMGLSGQNKKKK